MVKKRMRYPGSALDGGTTVGERVCMVADLLVLAAIPRGREAFEPRVPVERNRDSYIRVMQDDEIR